MKILITGATGFVGKTLVPWLCRENKHQPALLVRSPEKARRLFPQFPDIEVIPTSGDWAARIKEFNPEATLHLATFFTGRCDPENAEEIVKSNILFPTLLLEALSHTPCQYFINTGTFSEFLCGDGKYLPNNLYSASKTALRPIIRFYQSISAFKWINVVIYSPYGRHNQQKKIIDYLIDSVGSPTPVAFSEGKQVLDFIHVDDIASFFSTLFDKIHTLPAPFHEFHLGTGRGISLREAARVIEKVYGKPVNADWGKLPYRPNDIMHAVAPVSANLSLLGWQSEIPFEKGIRILKEDMLTFVKSGGGKMPTPF